MAEIRCPVCRRLLIVTGPAFVGLLATRCRRCGIDYAMTDDVAPDRLDCSCGKWLATGRVEAGWAQLLCNRDRALVRLRPSGASLIESSRRAPHPDELVAMIEQRWETMRTDRIRKKADIAVGLRFDVFNRDGFRCVYCGRGPDQGVYLEADHRLARSRGGPDTLANLVTACWDCNRGKSDKLLAG